MKRTPSRKILFHAPGLILYLMLNTSGVHAHGGPPLLTDDTGTPGDGKWEINVALTVEITREERLFENPHLDINYGWGDRIQLNLEAPCLVIRSNGERTINGPENPALGLKWRFFDQEEHGFDVSVSPRFEFNNPTASEEQGLVEKRSELVLPVAVEKKLGPILVNLELGYTFSLNGEYGQLFGLALGHELSERVELLGEVYGVATEVFDDTEWIFNLGTRLKIHQRFNLLAAGGRSLGGSSDSATDLLAYLGVQINL